MNIENCIYVLPIYTFSITLLFTIIYEVNCYYALNFSLLQDLFLQNPILFDYLNRDPAVELLL